MTADRDFGELVLLRRLVTAGVVLIRLGERTDEEQAGKGMALFASHGGVLPGASTVVTADRVRLRPRLGMQP